MIKIAHIITIYRGVVGILEAKLGAAGIERIREHFNENRIVEFWRDYYLQNLSKVVR